MRGGQGGEHERPAPRAWQPAHEIGKRDNGCAPVVVEHANVVQRELTSLRATRANFVFGGRRKFKVRWNRAGLGTSLGGAWRTAEERGGGRDEQTDGVCEERPRIAGQRNSTSLGTNLLRFAPSGLGWPQFMIFPIIGFLFCWFCLFMAWCNLRSIGKDEVYLNGRYYREREGKKEQCPRQLHHLGLELQIFLSRPICFLGKSR